MSILLYIFLAVEIDEQNYEVRELIFEKKRQETLKKPGSIFIRISTSDTIRVYDTDYEVSKIQISISKFKDKKIKEQEDNIKEQEDKIKNLEDKIKSLKTSINKSKCLK